MGKRYISPQQIREKKHQATLKHQEQFKASTQKFKTDFWGKATNQKNNYDRKEINSYMG